MKGTCCLETWGRGCPSDQEHLTVSSGMSGGNEFVVNTIEMI